MGMDQYLLIPFLGEWTSIYQLFWWSPGVQGFDTLPYRGFSIAMWITGESPVVKPWSQGTSARQKNHPQNLCTRHSPGRLDTFGHQVTIGDLWSLLGSWFLMGFSMDGDGMSFSIVFPCRKPQAMHLRSKTPPRHWPGSNQSCAD